ncbi:MAG: Mur ligase family protein [Bacteroidota bacterium]
MKIHFIAIGGSIMHSLAIALKQNGHEVSGSDDGIYDPARSKLEAHGLLPDYKGWNPQVITPDIDVVILGMHAFEDNPELLVAKDLGLAIQSFPEFIFEHARHKQRIVVAGSYGKTSVTAMIMHVLQEAGKKFDYLVGAQVDGFDNPVRLSEEAPIIVIEGDEYLASKLDARPKFLHYKPHILVLNGISWDHINVFPTEEGYVEQFDLLLKSLEKAADIIYNEKDKRLKQLIEKNPDESYYLYPFKVPSYKVKEEKWEIKLEGKKQALDVIGKHNMANAAAAWEVCELLGLEIGDFLSYLQDFGGAKLRMETSFESPTLKIIRDYAHAPEKVQATVQAVADTYKDHKLIACLELHTFSSLDRSFLPQYHKTMKEADDALVFVNPKQFEKRRMKPLEDQEIITAFGHKNVAFIQDISHLMNRIKQRIEPKTVILMMSSGNFQGLNIADLLSE